ncbi:MAG: hypothetical protein HY606_05990 [Planctomycetes bacterium]|nr:hypothetical protein [Planctomycetota bacterium]
MGISTGAKKLLAIFAGSFLYTSMGFNQNPGVTHNVASVKPKRTAYFLVNCYKEIKSHDPELYLSINDGELEQILPDGSGHTENVEISTNGEYIAYSKGHNEKSEVYVMRLSDRKETRITDNAHSDVNPNFINNEKGDPEYVVWFKVIDDIANLYRRKIDASDKEINISPDKKAQYWDPECSPDGKKIAFVHDNNNSGGKTTVIIVGEFSKTKDKIINTKIVSDTTKIARTDPSWNQSSDKLMWDEWDRDNSTGKYWFKEGWQDGYQQYWKILRANADGTNREVIWVSLKDDPINFLPIWTDNENEVLVTGAFAKQSNKDKGEFSGIFKLTFDGKKFNISKYRKDTTNCSWFDFVAVKKD